MHGRAPVFAGGRVSSPEAGPNSAGCRTNRDATASGPNRRSLHSPRMEPSGFTLFWTWLTALIATLSFGPSFAHVLESLPRLKVWSPELWREATVFNGQFQLFLYIGAPLDMLAVAAPASLAFLVRANGAAALVAGAGAVFFAVALALWFLLVFPANQALATWTPGPIPADFDALRWRWETGHMVVASAKLIGLAFILLALMLIGRSVRTG
jgi:hypothetical protein